MPMLLPPSQYDHPPQIPVIEKVLPWNELQRLCRASERPIYNGTRRSLTLRFKMWQSSASPTSANVPTDGSSAQS